MERDEPLRSCNARYREIQNARRSAKVRVHLKTLGKVLLAWDYDMSTEDALRTLNPPMLASILKWMISIEF
jgi:hypothetical protein